ncbi:MAG: septum formation initiator family protein [Acidobacteria bacterium]|nr:septum formation initiator family protein [Acidobacteriota bacterium]
MTAARGRTGEPGLKRSALRTLFWFLTAILLFNAFFGDMGIIEAVRQRRTARRLRHEVVALRTANDTLRAEIEGLRRDPFRIESIAREELGLSRPGELIFLFQDSWGDPDAESELDHP